MWPLGDTGEWALLFVQCSHESKRPSLVAEKLLTWRGVKANKAFIFTTLFSHGTWQNTKDVISSITKRKLPYCTFCGCNRIFWGTQQTQQKVFLVPPKAQMISTTQIGHNMQTCDKIHLHAISRKMDMRLNSSCCLSTFLQN